MNAPKTANSASSRNGPALSRAVEAFIMSACLVVVMITLLVWPGTRTLSTSTVICGTPLAIGAIALCARWAWRGATGFALLTALLPAVALGFWFDHASNFAAQASKSLLFTNAGDSVRGAEFWVNGVNLGPTPVRMTKDEFLRRVPRWDKPPVDFKAETLNPVLSSDWEQCWPRAYTKYEAFDDKTLGMGTLYFRAQYAGETAIATGSGSFGENIGVEFIFPKRRERLQLLLNQARLADYHVADNWFRALDTFDEDGWISLRKAAQTEAGMDDVLTNWAKWKYNLYAVKTPDAAWAALQRICSEADQRHRYLTPSVAGRAVELLARQVDPETLVKAGRELIANTTSASYVVWQLAGQTRFATADEGEVLSFLGFDDPNDGNCPMSWGGGNGGGGSPLSPGGLVIAHALAAMWQAGLAHELIHAKIAPDLLIYHHADSLTLPLEIATEIGGPEVDKFLLAQDWRHSSQGPDQSFGVFALNGGDVNRWLYLLAQLDDDAGRQFRREHTEEVLKMAGQIGTGGFMNSWDHHLDFLKQDHEISTQFFPRFIAAIQNNSSDQTELFRMEYTYLEQTDAPPAAYVEAWKQSKPSWEAANQGIGVLRYATPLERGRPAAAALLDFLQNDPHAMDQIPEPNERADLREWLQKVIAPQDQLLASLRDEAKHNAHLSKDFAARHMDFPQAALWLSRPGGLSPVVPMLAADPEPQLRLLSLIAIRGVPIARNRQLLQTLLADPVPEVQAEARSAQADLNALAKRPSNELTSDGGVGH